MTLFECIFMDEMQITIVIMHIHYTCYFVLVGCLSFHVLLNHVSLSLRNETAEKTIVYKFCMPF